MAVFAKMQNNKCRPQVRGTLADLDGWGGGLDAVDLEGARWVKLAGWWVLVGWCLAG